MFIMISLSLLGEEDRNDGFIWIGVGEEVKRVCVYYDFPPRERMIEAMNSFVWDLGEKRKECVFIMISLSPRRGG